MVVTVTGTSLPSLAVAVLENRATPPRRLCHAGPCTVDRRAARSHPAHATAIRHAAPIGYTACTAPENTIGAFLGILRWSPRSFPTNNVIFSSLVNTTVSRSGWLRFSGSMSSTTLTAVAHNQPALGLKKRCEDVPGTLATCGNARRLAFRLRERYVLADVTQTTTGCFFFEHKLALAHIIGNIVHDLYAPKRSRTSRTSIAMIEALDRKLMAWKHGLPPHLRFDLEHSAEADGIFEAQRGGLAWEFHNLRALIHRPHVCGGMDTAQIENTVRQQIMASGQICVAEAQIVARMLYRTPNRRPVSYPLYHLIPFVVGTCTILLVAGRYSTFTVENSTFGVDQLEADVENCVPFLDSSTCDSAFAAAAASEFTYRKRAAARLLYQPDATASSSSFLLLLILHLMMAMHGQNTLLYPPTIPLNSVPPPPMQSTSEINFPPNEQWQAWPEDYFDSLMMWPSQFVLPTEYNMPPLAEASWSLPVNLESQGPQQQQQHPQRQGPGANPSGHGQGQHRQQNQP
ncbi:hypothetical protein BST61_g8573 [Cercospora zeina]